MCDAVVRPVNPLNVTLTCNVLAAGSRMTMAVPVPNEEVAGFSLLPLRLATKAIGAAWLAGTAMIRAAMIPDASDTHFV